jgi:hypothetical protein
VFVTPGAQQHCLAANFGFVVHYPDVVVPPEVAAPIGLRGVSVGLALLLERVVEADKQTNMVAESGICGIRPGSTRSLWSSCRYRSVAQAGRSTLMAVRPPGAGAGRGPKQGR